MVDNYFAHYQSFVTLVGIGKDSVLGCSNVKYVACRLEQCMLVIYMQNENLLGPKTMLV